jgi:hypothetical protein
MGCRLCQYLTPQSWCKGVKDEESWHIGPIRYRPKTHIRQERGDKVHEVGVKRDSTRTNEEFSGCNLPNVRKKVSTPVDVMLPVCILLNSAGFAELCQELLGWGLLFPLVAAHCEEHAIVCSVKSDNLIAVRCHPDPPIALYNLPSLRCWQTPGKMMRDIDDNR